jgi:hypothetical protein
VGWFQGVVLVGIVPMACVMVPLWVVVCGGNVGLPADRLVERQLGHDSTDWQREATGSAVSGVAARSNGVIGRRTGSERAWGPNRHPPMMAC